MSVGRSVTLCISQTLNDRNCRSVGLSVVWSAPPPVSRELSIFRIKWRYVQNRLGLEACIGHKYLAPPLLGRGHAHFSDFFGLKYRFYAILGHLEHFCSLLVSFGQFWSVLATYGLAAASEVDELMSRRSQVKKSPFLFTQ